MNLRNLFVPLLAALLLATTALAVACDGDGGDPLTLDEFFQELQALDDDLEARSTELEAGFDDLTEESSVEDVEGLFRDLAVPIEEFVESVADLDPPDEAADVHDEAVSAGRAVVDAFDSIIDDAAEADSIEAFFAVFEDTNFEAAADRFTQACLDMEQLAADNGISVDFDCDEE